MRLPKLSRDRQVWLNEFDLWITPYLEEIRDSAIFSETLRHIKSAIEQLGAINGNFHGEVSMSGKAVAEALLKGAEKDSNIFELVSSYCDLLFLITGKTDNNCKCQFPVYLRQSLGIDSYPVIQKKQLSYGPIPRVLTYENIARLVSQLNSLIADVKVAEPGLDSLKRLAALKTAQRSILSNYFDFILNQDLYLKSLNFFGKQYFELKNDGLEDTLLAPMVIAYVRGSASATGGHLPEGILREYMNSWGMKANEDYNTNDVVPYEVESTDTSKKRAYDFVLPFNIKGWGYRIFVQSQFYAGDSGSVSHKNVDQTTNSRAAVKKKHANPIFIEYLDGAGYYSSLNGDLKRILNMPDTENFIQVRTSPLKLRQVLQDINFLIPIELVHAINSENESLLNAQKKLLKEGYSQSEIDRVIKKSLDEGIILVKDNFTTTEQTFYKISRRYYLLDIFAVYGQHVPKEKREKDNFYVAGFGDNHGGKLSELLSLAKADSGRYFQDWSDPIVLGEDMEYLLEKKWIQSL